LAIGVKSKLSYTGRLFRFGIDRKIGAVVRVDSNGKVIPPACPADQ
jgi:hypothetical protein